ncbi:sensor histidine kinase [Streptomyces thermocarboxydus]
MERALHDGTQNRIVAVTVLLGAARRALARDPEEAAAVLDRAQDAAEQALTELRAVVRSILPPVLADRSLPDALTALAAAARCPAASTPTCPRAARRRSRRRRTSRSPRPSPTSPGTAARARRGSPSARPHGLLHVEVRDDGHGGAGEHGGTGLTGIRRRVEAHDGTLELASPPGGPTTLKVTLPCGS